MASVKRIKIRADIFNNEKILLVESLPNADSIIVVWLRLICMAGKQKRQGYSEWRVSRGGDVAITDDVLTAIFRRKDAPEIIQTLEKYGFIERGKYAIHIIPFWIDGRDRDAARYKEWRDSVFKRDGYICQECGTKQNLHAHHIVFWRDCIGEKENLRYSIENGITLCKDCHLKAHGGCWHG